MKCVAERATQTRLDSGKIAFFNRDDVEEFKECPPNFRPVAGEVPEADEVDFTKAEEAELMAATWKFADAQKAVKEAYGVTLKKKDKENIVAQILDARFRALSPADTDHTR